MKCEYCKYCYGEDEKGHICRLAGCEARLSDSQVERCENGIDEDSGEKIEDDDYGQNLNTQNDFDLYLYFNYWR